MKSHEVGEVVYILYRRKSKIAMHWQIKMGLSRKISNHIYIEMSAVMRS
jgi:hypothetical protein